MNNTTTTLTSSFIGQLKEAIQSGIESWATAGKAVISLVDQGMTLEQIAQEADSPFINVNVLAQFERIGRQQVLPRLLVADFPASRHLERLPTSEQNRLIDGSVELLVFKDGSTDVLNVQVSDLTKKQCKQVFSRVGTRSLGAQRAYLEDQRGKTPAKQALWHIKSGKVQFSGACELSRQELAVILAQMA